MKCAEPIDRVSHSCRHIYRVYGVDVESEIELALPTHGHGGLAQVEVLTAPPGFFSDVTQCVSLDRIHGSWYEIGWLPDDSIYARWTGVGEFLVSGDGRRIVCRQFDASTKESFQVYLLGQALSFALVQSGFEPLHATVVVIDGEAVALLGQSGFGKSTLAASFLASGHQLLTDDLLLLQIKNDRVIAYPGPGRIKLFPKDARRFLGSAANGVRMNTETKKLIVSLDSRRCCLAPVPLRAAYALTSPREVSRQQRICCDILSAREAFLELLKNTFNRRILNADRLKRQFDENSRLAAALPFTRLSFPRILRQISSVRDAILSDLTRQRPSACFLETNN